MTLPGLGTLKTWGIAALAAGLAIVTILWKMSQLGRVRDKVAGMKQARETEKRASTAAIEGLQNEKDKVNSVTADRTDFN